MSAPMPPHEVQEFESCQDCEHEWCYHFFRGQTIPDDYRDRGQLCSWPDCRCEGMLWRPEINWQKAMEKARGY